MKVENRIMLLEMMLEEEKDLEERQKDKKGVWMEEKSRNFFCFYRAG